MAVHITADEGVVALFDSTSGIAFGPVFDSVFDAENFIAWSKQEKGVQDLRQLDPGKLSTLVSEFNDGPTNQDYIS